MIKQSLSSLLVIVLLWASAGNIDQGEKKDKEAKKKIDTCKIIAYKGQRIELKISCGGCHDVTPGERYNADIPKFSEISDRDSLFLMDFIFKGKHNGRYLRPRYKSSNKILDSLSACDRRNLLHYIKSFNRDSIAVIQEGPAKR